MRSRRARIVFAVLTACSCGSGTTSAAEGGATASGEHARPRGETPAAPESAGEPQKQDPSPALDPATCDRAIVETRKCVVDLKLDDEAKEAAIRSLDALGDLWAMRGDLPPERQVALCKRLLDNAALAAEKLGCKVPREASPPEP